MEQNIAHEYYAACDLQTGLITVFSCETLLSGFVGVVPPLIQELTRSASRGFMAIIISAQTCYWGSCVRKDIIAREMGRGHSGIMLFVTACISLS